MGIATKYSRNVADASLIVARALPGGASTVNSASLDLEINPTQGILDASINVFVEAPALSTAQLPDTQTVTYNLQESADNVTFTTVQVLGVQTGAGGVGATAVNLTNGISETTQRYLRLSITKSGAGSASAVSANFKLVF